MNQKRLKLKILYLSILFIALFSFIDRIVLENLLFGFPNELEWDTSPWFNFLEKRRRIKFSENEKGALIVGSSVALYSSLPERMNEKLKNTSIRTEFYSHPALTPSDFYFYKEDIASKKPKLVFFVLNPADLQLDFLITEKENEARLAQYKQNLLYQENSIIDFQNLEYSEKTLDEVSATTRHQNRMIYPAQYLREKYKNILRIGKSAFLSLLSRSLFLVVRYRSFLYDPMDAWIENHLRSGRSYHYYTGIIPEEGIYLRGWAKPEFSIDCELKNGIFEESVFFQEKDTTLRIWGEGKAILFDKTFPKSGWHTIKFNVPEKSDRTKLRISSDKKISSLQVDSRIFGTEEIYGIRLSQNFCRNEIRKHISYIRIPGLDDARLSKMDDTTYSKDYTERIYGYKGESSKMSRLVTLRMAKIKLSSSPKFFTWSELEYLKKGIEYLEEQGIQVVLVNSPENPIEREVYEFSPWYKGYISYLENLGKTKYKFKNAISDFEDKRSFLDPHHLTYEASERSSDLYAEWILETLAEK
ncbi:hypothetical protein [Leptospira licerasiae]|uniref:SGNH/GDSL hydrolase family protein n=1 Tax=Leptospira licerasiae str. MMD4847 TaxID=1049971 RepID=A0ABN0HEL1_9LEPT|nr:hypothetical protein [Leptospira licerasiae]EIE00996.1 hypothetical protein LEP1GSC185_3621 [Leptospira licerasiae serovar Varillal str. VAR 010]EJZ44079.1 hypothetical protein LEP1GSC178_2274 [Leptospira licerasiae str. MMD4847]